MAMAQYTESTLLVQLMSLGGYFLSQTKKSWAAKSCEIQGRDPKDASGKEVKVQIDAPFIFGTCFYK